MEGHAWELFGAALGGRATMERRAWALLFQGRACTYVGTKQSGKACLGHLRQNKNLEVKKKPEVKTCEAKTTFRSKKPLRYNQPLEVKQKTLRYVNKQLSNIRGKKLFEVENIFLKAQLDNPGSKSRHHG